MSTATTPVAHNYPTHLASYEAALAAYHAAVSELHAAHVTALACGNSALSAETRAALGVNTAIAGLEHKVLDGKLTLLAATVNGTTADEVKAAIEGLHGKRKALATAKAALAVARTQLDAALDTADKAAEATCHDLQALHGVLTAPKK